MCNPSTLIILYNAFLLSILACLLKMHCPIILVNYDNAELYSLLDGQAGYWETARFGIGSGKAFRNFWKWHPCHSLALAEGID